MWRPDCFHFSRLHRLFVTRWGEVYAMLDDYSALPNVRRAPPGCIGGDFFDLARAFVPRHARTSAQHPAHRPTPARLSEQAASSGDPAPRKTLSLSTTGPLACASFWHSHVGELLCAPGAKWAKRDRAAFEEEFK